MSKIIISFNIHRFKEILLRISISAKIGHYRQFTNSSFRTTIKDYDIHLYRLAQKERIFLKWVVVRRVKLFRSLGYLKSKVYVRKPRTVDDLKVSISEEIATVPQEMLVNMIQSFEERLRTCVRQEGRHLSDIIFRN